MALVTSEQIKTWVGASDSEDPFLAMLAPAVSQAVKNYCKQFLERAVWDESYETDANRSLFLRQTPLTAVPFTGDTTANGTTVANVSSAVTPYLFQYQSVTGPGIPSKTTIASVSSTSITLSQAATATAAGVSLTGGLAAWVDMTARYGENPDGAFDPTTILVEGVDYLWKKTGHLPGTNPPVAYGRESELQRVVTVWPAGFMYRFGQVTLQQVTAPGVLRVKYVAGWPTVPDDLVGACCELAAVMRAQRQKGRALQSEGIGAYNYAYATTMLNTMPELGSVRQLLTPYRRQIV